MKNETVANTITSAIRPRVLAPSKAEVRLCHGVGAGERGSSSGLSLPVTATDISPGDRMIAGSTDLGDDLGRE